MPGPLIPGRRVQADASGDLRLAEGDYGYSPRAQCWQCRPPGCHAGSLRGHEVTEHPDGTITVRPSILLTDFNDDGDKITWHGWLTDGQWKKLE